MERRWKFLVVTLDVTLVNLAFPDLERDFSGASRADVVGSAPVPEAA